MVHYVHYVHWTSPLQTVVCFLFIFFWATDHLFATSGRCDTFGDWWCDTSRRGFWLTRLLTRFDLQIIGVENRNPSFHGFAPKCFVFCPKWNWRYLPVGTDRIRPWEVLFRGSSSRDLGIQDGPAVNRWISLFSLRKSMAIWKGHPPHPPFSDRARYHIAGYLPIFFMFTLWLFNIAMV